MLILRWRRFTGKGAKIYKAIIDANDGKPTDLLALQTFLLDDQFEGQLWNWHAFDPNDES